MKKVEKEKKNVTETKQVNSRVEKDEDILVEFKNEVFGRDKKGAGAILFISFLILLVFGFLGVAAYQIFFKPESIEAPISSEEKIENRPEVKDDEVKKEEPKVETPKVTAPVVAPQPEYVNYSVQEGDTWSSIANSNGMSSADLMKYNGATSENLQIGQNIKVPK